MTYRSKPRPAHPITKAKIADLALDMIAHSYRTYNSMRAEMEKRGVRYSSHEPCWSVGEVTDMLRQQSMPADFEFASKRRQRTMVRIVLEKLRREGRLSSSIGSVPGRRREIRCYEPA
jgi:hypothetical protein